ncbi:hypothetical protein ENUP19_0284G0056 [Entamoeba nuttalli]|uniref:ATP-dependent DNA helicase n=2 Tax=Entamoeba nuttalli TaxID=412467 RepID=K2H375_ENTNP|nr:DNA repair and recombination protein, putative [Entamoeba nuttalli P19]EKE41958.1 DNA repair and recombination protein, putative [Entamoeba nuttalli P19]|eukprot:XP_008855707.1 DNA repair and recombination protein, putative [Entamoeba nuttalli P19]
MSFFNPMVNQSFTASSNLKLTNGIMQSLGKQSKYTNKPQPIVKTKTLPKSFTAGVKTKSSIRTLSEIVQSNSKKEFNYHLSSDQELVLKAALEGKSFFFTGAAGCGKSYVLSAIVEKLKHDKEVYVTASTGIAACNVNGMTIHSFSGIGKGEGSSSELWDKVKRDKKALKKWNKVEVLIIDEISMIDGDLFDKLEFIARKARNNNLAFGGIQMIICGDFCQLPPISRNGTTKFAFESNCWNKVIPYCYYLTTVHRQNDQKFITLLNGIRIGEINDEMINCLKGCCDKECKQQCTHLLSYIKEVDDVNTKELQKLQGNEVVYHSIDTGNSIYLTSMKITDELHLKAGAFVMINKNIDVERGLVNGSVGVVIGFDETSLFSGQPVPIVQLSNRTLPISECSWDIELGNQLVAKRSQIPLQLAWAISIHKSQGMTLERAVIRIDNVFETGQAYVALSRLKSLDGLYIEGSVIKERIKCNEKAKKFDLFIKNGRYNAQFGDKTKEVVDKDIMIIEDDTTPIHENNTTTHNLEIMPPPRKSCASLMDFEDEEDDEGFVMIESLQNDILINKAEQTNNKNDLERTNTEIIPPKKSVINTKIFTELENDWEDIDIDDDIPIKPRRTTTPILSSNDQQPKKKPLFSSELFNRGNSKIYIEAPQNLLKDHERKSGRLSFSSHPPNLEGIKRPHQPPTNDLLPPTHQTFEELTTSKEKQNESLEQEDKTNYFDITEGWGNSINEECCYINEFEDNEGENLEKSLNEDDMWMKLYGKDIFEGNCSSYNENKSNTVGANRKSSEIDSESYEPKKKTQTIEDLLNEKEPENIHPCGSKTDPIKIDDFDIENHEE